MEIFDISVPVRSEMPIWPGSPGVRLDWVKRIENGDVANVSKLETGSHVGTHVDAPLHFIVGGKSAEQLDLGILIGPAVVVELPDCASITATDLAALDLPPQTERLLLKTRNSRLWARGVTVFTDDFVALTADAAEWVVDNGIKLVGVDYLSVQRYQDGPDTHRILLGADVVVLEGLNLSAVSAGSFALICLPLRLVGADGAPARAVLLRAFDELQLPGKTGGDKA